MGANLLHALRAHRRASAAVVLTVAAVLLAAFLLGPRSPLTMAEVMAAVNGQPWVHVKYSNGREQWVSLRDDLVYARSEDGRVTFFDCARGIHQVYSPGYTTGYISEDTFTPFSLGRTPWDSVLGSFEGSQRDLAKDYDAERHPDTINGTEVVRFDVYYKDALGGKVLAEQIWADPRTRLPVRIRLQFAEREEHKRESITGEYDFPASGPASIYDLGVPRNLPIVNAQEKPAPPPEVAQVLEASRKAQEAFPRRYRAVIWPQKQYENIEITYRDGEKIRSQYYFNLGPEHPEYSLPLPATAEEVLHWAQGQTPHTLCVNDPEVTYLKTGTYPAPLRKQSEPVVQVMRHKPFPFSDVLPEDYQWPPLRSGSQRIPDIIPGCIGLRWEAGDSRQDFYLDPEKDYVCINEVWWEKRNGLWQKTREYWLSDFALLPGHHWYATSRRLITFGNPQEGISRGGVIWNIDVKVLQEDEFPADCFNGMLLLEGAKVETY